MQNTSNRVYNYNYFDKWGSYAVDYSGIREKREVKNKINEEAQKQRKPIIAYNGMREVSKIIKRRKMEIGITDEDISYIKGKEKEFVDAYDRIPFKAKQFYGYSLLYKVTENERYGRLLKHQFDYNGGIKEIEDYYSGRMSQNDFESLFPTTPKGEEQNLFGESGAEESGNHQIVTITNLENYNKFCKAIRQKLNPTSKEEKEQSIRKGKKINPSFIKKSSWKPLINKDEIKPRKKKVFIIIDCSGSMGNENRTTEPSNKAISMAKALIDTNVLNCDYVICHTDEGYKNVANDLKKGNFITVSGCSEGFEEIDNNLNGEWLKDADFILTLTDLEIGSSAEQGLFDYLNRGKKHMILSFRKKGTLRGLRVRQINDIQDMVESVVSLVNN